jgi:hypothetical protein
MTKSSDSLEDTIRLRVSAEETVVNNTVKIVANISGMVTRDRTEPQLRESIRKMSNNFIPAADWQFAGLTRTADDSGLERIALIASARVPESENRALDKRRQEASMPDEGLTISRVTTDISFPSSLIEETERKLRLSIIAKALAEAEVLGKALDRTYRIQTLDYVGDDDSDVDTRNYQLSNRMSASGATKTAYGAGFRGDDDVIGNAQKLILTAIVTLAVKNQ